MGNILAVSNWDSKQIVLSDAYTNENENAKLISLDTNASGINAGRINASGINLSGGSGKKSTNKKKFQS